MKKTDNIYQFDQFFTKPEIAEFCIKKVNEISLLDDFDLIIEPSAGNGNFYNLLPASKRIGIELDNDLCSIYTEYLNKSFFDYSLDNDQAKILVIGNPPFGTQNNLSVDFFNHAALFANIIAFVIPKTWKKNSIQNRLNFHFHLLKSFDLPDDCFYGDKATSVKCCFQIWVKKDKLREKKINRQFHKDWQFLSYQKIDNDLKPPTNADFLILAYGSNPGQISTDLNQWRPKSVHFIKSNINIKILMDRFRSLNFNCANNSARQSSLCKGDLVELYIKKYGE